MYSISYFVYREEKKARSQNKIVSCIAYRVSREENQNSGIETRYIVPNVGQASRLPISKKFLDEKKWFPVVSLL